MACERTPPPRAIVVEHEVEMGPACMMTARAQHRPLGTRRRASLSSRVSESGPRVQHVVGHHTRPPLSVHPVDGL